MLISDQVNGAVYYTATCLSTLIIFFTMYVLIFNSSVTMHTYRNTLLNMLGWYLMATAPFGLILQPVYAELGPLTCVKLMGFGNYFGETVIFISSTVSALGVMNTATSIMLCFIYRYLALAHPHLLNQLRSTRVFIIGLAIHMIGNSVLVPIIVWFVLTAERVPYGTFLHYCVPPDQLHVIKTIIAVLVGDLAIHLVTVAVFLALSIHVLQRTKSMMCAKTYQLQRLMTRSLVVLATLPIVINGIPMIAAGMAFILRCGHIYEIASVVSHLPFIEVVFVCVFTISFVTPYRKAVISLITKVRTKNGNVGDLPFNIRN